MIETAEQLDSEVLCQHCGKPLTYFTFTVAQEIRDGITGVQATCCQCWGVNWFANGHINDVEKPKSKRKQK